MVHFKKKVCDECKKERNHIIRIKGQFVCGCCKRKLLHTLPTNDPISLKDAMNKTYTVHGYKYQRLHNKIKNYKSAHTSFPSALAGLFIRFKFENPEFKYDRIRLVNPYMKKNKKNCEYRSLSGSMSLPYKFAGQKFKIEVIGRINMEGEDDSQTT